MQAVAADFRDDGDVRREVHEVAHLAREAVAAVPGDEPHVGLPRLSATAWNRDLRLRPGPRLQRRAIRMRCSPTRRRCVPPHRRRTRPRGAAGCFRGRSAEGLRASRDRWRGRTRWGRWSWAWCPLGRREKGLRGLMRMRKFSRRRRPEPVLGRAGSHRSLPARVRYAQAEVVQRPLHNSGPQGLHSPCFPAPHPGVAPARPRWGPDGGSSPPLCPPCKHDGDIRGVTTSG